MIDLANIGPSPLHLPTAPLGNKCTNIDIDEECLGLYGSIEIYKFYLPTQVPPHSAYYSNNIKENIYSDILKTNSREQIHYKISPSIVHVRREVMFPGIPHVVLRTLHL